MAAAADRAAPISGDGTKKKKAVVLIDPVTDWRQVVDSALASDHVVIAAQLPDVALPEKFRSFTPTADALIEAGVAHTLFIYHRDVFHIMQQLQILQEECALQLEGVIPLSEVAVEVSDLVASCLGLPHNPLDTLTARRDKGLMKRAVRAAGMRVAKHARVNSVKELRAAMAELALSYPIVVKTPSGMSSTDVHICSDENEAIHALNCIIGNTGPDGRAVGKALLEEHIYGTEFAINLLAFDGGRHLLTTDMWKYTKNDNARYESAEMCNPFDHPELLSYAVDVARAVGIRFGAAHVELKATLNEDGRYVDPVMIEVGARLSGGRKSLMAQAAIDGWDPFASLIASHCGHPCPIKRDFLIPSRFARHIFLPVERAGTVKDVKLETEGLTMLHSSAMIVKIGDCVRETTDIVSCAGFVWLVGEEDEVDKDAAKVLSSFSLIMEETS